MSLSITITNIAIKICDYVAIFITVISYILFIINTVIQLRTKKCSIITTFSIQLGIILLINSTSYIIPDDEGVQCLIKALIHLASLTLTVNLIFIYYLSALLNIINYHQVNSFYFQFLLYFINYGITAAIIVFYSKLEPYINPLNTCRFKIEEPITYINTIYSAVMILLSCVIYCVMNHKINQIKQSIRDHKQGNDLKEKFDNSMKNFLLIMFMIVIKIGIFAFNWYFPIMVLDRLFEHVFAVVVYVVLGIGVNNLKRVLGKIIKRKPNEDIGKDIVERDIDDSDLI